VAMVVVPKSRYTKSACVSCAVCTGAFLTGGSEGGAGDARAARLDGLRDEGGGIGGFFPRGNGGLGLPLILEATELGLESWPRRALSCGLVFIAGGAGGNDEGGLGAPEPLFDSGSEA
jgi:hypothetical protein